MKPTSGDLVEIWMPCGVNGIEPHLVLCTIVGKEGFTAIHHWQGRLCHIKFKQINKVIFDGEKTLLMEQFNQKQKKEKRYGY